jgi:hypothetical protein
LKPGHLVKFLHRASESRRLLGNRAPGVALYEKLVYCYSQDFEANGRITGRIGTRCVYQAMLRQTTNLLGSSDGGPVAQHGAVWNCENTPQIVNSDTTLTLPRVPVRSSSNIVLRGARRGGWLVCLSCGVVGPGPALEGPHRVTSGRWRHV